MVAFLPDTAYQQLNGGRDGNVSPVSLQSTTVRMLRNSLRIKEGTVCITLMPPISFATVIPTTSHVGILS